MPTRVAYRFLAAAALLLFFALALDTAGRKAVTTDEPLHLTHSLTMRETGVMSIPEMHTPLVYRLVGTVLATEPSLPLVTALESWPTRNPYIIGRELLWRGDIDTDRVVWLGRFVVVGLGVLLGALMASWTWALTRHLPAAAVVLVLFALSPNLLAAASLVTTDMAATATWFATVYTWWRYWRRPGWGRWLLAAVCLGLALAAKLTGVLLLPATAALAFVGAAGVSLWPPNRGWLRPALLWLGLLPVAGLVLWAFYGFDLRGGLPLPAYVEAWTLLLREVDASHANFFMGRVLSEGSWLYFPVTLLLKTPLPALALWALGVGALLSRKKTTDFADYTDLEVSESVKSVESVAAISSWRDVAFLGLPAGLFLAVAVVSRLNYGYRHLLPAVPFLTVLGGLAVARLWGPTDVARVATPRSLLRAVVVVALGWTAVAALRTHPDYLAYFNELARGRGYRYLGDSNLDWGQDVNQTADYARAYGVETGRPLFISYAGGADPAHYGLTQPSITLQTDAGRSDFAPANPAAGRYAINVSDLQGVSLLLGNLKEIDLYDWFRRRAPLTALGGSVFIYNVRFQATGEWVAHCTAPGRLLSDAEADRLVGRAGLRHVTFDCATSWVFPGDAAGWYVLPPGETWLDGWAGANGLEVVYRHRANAYGPDYRIVYWPGGGAERLMPCPSSGIDSCSGGQRLRMYEAQTGGAAQLRGYGAFGAEWATVWRVSEATAAPLSVQAHLLGPGDARQVADGLGYSTDQWRPGDWFIQRHVFAAPGETLETGLYDYVTLTPAGPLFRLREEE